MARRGRERREGVPNQRAAAGNRNGDEGQHEHPNQREQ